MRSQHTKYKEEETLDACVIDLGKIERNLGSTFVQFSRFKKFTDFVVRPFPFDRLTKIANSSCIIPRTKEEERLDKLRQ
jgi:hypothetical protein